MSKKLLSEATLDEMRNFAKLIGIDVDGRWKEDRIISAMSNYGLRVDNPDFEINIVEKSHAEPVSFGGVGSWRVLINGRWEQCSEGDTGARFGNTINVPTEEREGGDRPIYTNHNGKTMLIPRGMDVWVPIEYVNALKSAVRELPVVDENGEISSWRQVPRRPFNVVA